MSSLLYKINATVRYLKKPSCQTFCLFISPDINLYPCFNFTAQNKPNNINTSVAMSNKDPKVLALFFSFLLKGTVALEKNIRE
jgi:hypothetical protein